MRMFTNIVSVLILFTTAIACRPMAYYMDERTAPLSPLAVRPQPGKSALVILRTSTFNRANTFHTYIDRSFIGCTRDRSYFAVTDVEPGPKFVSSWGENCVAVKVPFEAGKVYFILQTPTRGIIKSKVIMEARSAKQLDANVLSKCTYYDRKSIGFSARDLTEDELASAVLNAPTMMLKEDGSSEFIPAQ